MPFENLNKRILLITSIMVLNGCVSYDTTDLDQWTQEMLARPGGRIEPLPEIRPYEAYSYKSAEEGRLNPFDLFYVVRVDPDLPDGDVPIPPDILREIERNREELEQFELDSLRMVGTMEDSAEQWGNIVDPDGIVHRVSVGNYMGRNIGKIVNIFSDRIELREITKNTQGRWEERQAAIALIEQ